MRWTKLTLFLIGISYLVHLFVVRLPYISVHAGGYMAKITPVCWAWNVASLVALILFAYLYAVKEIGDLEEELKLFE